jgi:hypothetical protein
MSGLAATMIETGFSQQDAGGYLIRAYRVNDRISFVRSTVVTDPRRDVRRPVGAANFRFIDAARVSCYGF